MKRKLLCIGGTGQMVLHYYVQLYLLGAIKEPFEAVVIDTDEVIGSIQVARDFFSDLQYGEKESAALGGEVPVINPIRVKPPPADNAFEALTGHKNLEAIHPARAFFSRDSLNQDLFKGLFARPALSSVVIQRELHVPHNRALLKPESQSTVVIVGSLIGGTGGGLMAPIIDAVASDCRREQIQHVKIRAVLFREYFHPDPDRVESDVHRFKSNQVFVLCATKEALEELHSYCIRGGGGPEEPLIQRNPEQEREGENIPWPEKEIDPLWKGAQAVEYLCEETTIDKREDFADREIVKFDSPVSLEEARRLWRTRLSAADTFIQKKVVERAAHDPSAEGIWGREFVDILAHFWTLTAEKEGGWEKVKDFPDKLQESLKVIWEGGSERGGLRSIFPALTGSRKVSPRDIRRINWPRVKEGSRCERLFTDSDTIARKAAATLLYWILRGRM